MRQTRACWLSFLVVLLMGCAAPRAIFVIRHAERADDSDDTALSAAGHARALALAETLAQAGIDTIFTSEFRRSRDTAAPLGRRLGLTPKVVSSKDGARLAQQVLQQHGVVLIVGHSNTIPALLGSLRHRPGSPRSGIPAAPVRIAHDDYDDLFLLLPRSGGATNQVRLRQPLALP